MPLIQCPDCGKDVSTRAPSCPNCGAPVATISDVRATGAPLTTIQATAKRLKIEQLAATVAIIISVIGLMAAEPYSTETEIWGWAAFIGFIWFVIIRIRMWWHHG